MNLREFLYESNMTVRSFSKLIGYNQSYISLVLNGSTPAGAELRGIIQKMSYGKVDLKNLASKRPERKRKILPVSV